MATLKQIVQFHSPRANPNWIANDDDNYYSWRSETDGDPEPIQAQLDAAEAAYDDALEYGAMLLESNKSSITGNGTDAATVTVTFRLPYPDTILLRAGEQIFPLSFSPKGIGTPFTRTAQITNLTSIYPGETIVIEPYDWFAPDFPGGDSIEIEVT